MADRDSLGLETRVHSVVGGFYDSYNVMGFGFREELCCRALARELTARGHLVQREFNVQVMYKGEPLGLQRVDFLVDTDIVLEVKATYALPPDAKRQLYNYLRATNLTTGILFHYGPKPRFYRVSLPP
jgi:GxxExxY protein